MKKAYITILIATIATALTLYSGPAQAQVHARTDIYNVLRNSCSNYLDVTVNDQRDTIPTFQLLIVAQPAHGTATVNGQYLSYCPTSGYLGADNFKYAIVGTTGTDTASVYINVVNYNSSVFIGDADQNGKVENFDVLALGLAYSLSGPSRTDSAAVMALAWAPSPYINSNPGAADCNGDGIVDSLDLYSIDATYQSVISAVPYQAVDTSECKNDGIPFYIQSLTGDTVQDGDTMEIALMLGDVGTLNEAYGIAFTLNFDNGFIPASAMDISTGSSWLIHNDGGLFFKRGFQNTGELEIALTKTNHQPQNGAGELLRIRVPIDDNIDGIVTAPGPHVLDMHLSKVRLVSPYDILRDVCMQQPNFVVNKKLTGTNDLPNAVLKIYPSPTNGNMIVEAAGIKKVEVTDLIGRKLYAMQANGTNHLSIDLQPLGLANGTYFIKVETQQTTYTKQIFIQR